MGILIAMLRGFRKALFFPLLWVRPLVHLPLRLLSYASLFAFGVTLLIPHPVPFYSRVLMASVGIGSLLLTYIYDSLLRFLSEDILTLGD